MPGLYSSRVRVKALFLGLFVVAGAGLASWSLVNTPKADAATSTYLNFQARLLTSSGAVVADGNYHIEFKIYDSAGSGASAQGVCSLDSSTDDCWWRETRTTGNLVRVVNGYFSVQLGSVTAFGANVPWDQQLWLTMNIGGTGGSPSWDGEMLTAGNRIQLTGVPYAFTAGRLQAADSGFTNKLVFATPSGSNKTLTLPNETGTVCTTGSICSGYAGATTFTLQNAYDNSGPDAVIALSAADDSIIFRNPASGGSDSTYILTVDQLSTGARGGLSIQSAGTGNLLLVTDTTATARDVLTIADGGATTFRNQTNSVTAFQILNAAGAGLLLADTANLRVGVNIAPITDLSVAGTTGLHLRSTVGSPEGGRITWFGDGTGWKLHLQARNDAGTLQGSSPVMTLIDTGEVGIGTASPTAKLQVHGSSAAVAEVGTISIRGVTDTNNKLNFGYDESNNYSWIQSVRTGDGGRHLVLSIFRLGVNDFDPTAQLSLGGTGSDRGISFGDDAADPVSLYRSGANTLKTDDDFLVKTAINSTTAFQVQNSSGLTVLNTSTSTAVQLVSNNSIETSINGWVGEGTVTLDRSQAVTAQFGSSSLSIVTDAASEGAHYKVPLVSGTQYSLSIWARQASGSAAVLDIGYEDDADSTCLTGQTLSATWTQYTCTFTPNANGTSSNIFVKQSDATSRTIYIDGASLVTGATSLTYNSGGNQLDLQGSTGNVNLNNSNTGELQAWQLNANALPAIRGEHSSVVANGYMYVIGGHNGTAAQSTVYYSKLNTDGSTGAWTTNANALPAVREWHSSVVANGYIYVIGGSSDGSTMQSTVYYAKLNADGSTGAWSTNANALPASRANHSSVVNNGYVYVIGGIDGSSVLSTVYYAKLNADGSTGAWSTNANALPAVRQWQSSAIANGYVYAVGGCSTTNCSTIVNTVYHAKLNADGSTGTWTTSTSNLPTALYGAGPGVVADGYVYYVGGCLNTACSSLVNTVYYSRLNSDGSIGAWSTAANSLPPDLGRHATATSNGYIYALGGWSESGAAYQSTIYYSSVSRILIGGSLDLVGLGGQNLADGGDFSQGSTGGSLTAGNTKIVGSLEVQGQANFSQNVAFGKDLTVGGSLFQAFGGLNYMGGADAGNSGTTVLPDFNEVFTVGRYSYVGTTGDTTACGSERRGCELQVYDITNPASPTFVGGADVSNTNNNGDDILALQVVGQYAYVHKLSNTSFACNVDRVGCELQIYDISNPSQPTFVGGADHNNSGTGGTFDFDSGIFVSGKYVYLAKGGDSTSCIANRSGCELQIYDVSNPANPTFVGGADSENIATGSDDFYTVSVQGSFAYVGKEGDSGTCSSSSKTGCEFQIYDISNPTSPQFIGGADSANAGNGTDEMFESQIVGRYIYLAKDGNSTDCTADRAGCDIQIYDISNPASPAYVSGIDSYTGSSSDDFLDIHVSGRYLFAGKEGSPDTCTSTTFGTRRGCEAQAFDISNPATPVFVGGADASSTGTGNRNQFAVHVSGRYAYFAKHTNGTACSSTSTDRVGCELQVYDISGVETTSVITSHLETGSLAVKSDGQILGNLDVSQGVNIGQSLLVQGDIGVGGWATFRNQINSTTAFQLQGAAGNTILNVNTANNDNLLINGSFEGATNGWVATGGSTLSSSTAQKYVGNASMLAATSTTDPSGTSYTFPFKANTDYIISFYARLDSGTMSVFEYGRTINSSSTNCATAQTLDTTWRRFSCTFNAGATVTQSDLLYFRKTGTSTFNIHMDGVMLEQGNSQNLYADPGFSLTNLIGNASFENGNTNGWVLRNLTGTSATIAGSNEFAKFGSSSLKLVTSTGNGNGAEYRYPFQPSTQYTLGLWARRDTSSAAGFNVGRSETTYTTGTASQSTTTVTGVGTTWTSAMVGGLLVYADGTTDTITAFTNATTITVATSRTVSSQSYTIYLPTPTADCLVNQTFNTTWTFFTCTFVTGATIGDKSSIYLKQTDTTTDNIFIDGVTLVQDDNPLTFNQGGSQIDLQAATSNITLNSPNSGELQAWQLNANSLPAGRSSPTSVTANGYVYVIGGTGTLPSATVYYGKLNTDGSIGSWNTANALPTGRRSHSSVVANGYLYVIGGVDGGSSTVKTVNYAKLNADGTVGTWNTTIELPDYRFWHSSVVANGYVYVTAGRDGSSNPSTSIYYARLNSDGTLGSWATTNTIPAAREKHSSVIANGYLYVIGGYNSGYQTTIYYARLNSNGTVGTWNTATSLPLPAGRIDHTSVVANGYVYVIGGDNLGAGQSTVYYARLNSDGTVGSWSTAQNNLPTGLFQHTSVAANGYIYAVGGAGGASNISTVYYASTSRILLGGSLDLVGLGGQNLAEGGDFSQGGTGGSLTAGNTKIVGSLEVAGQANFGQGVSVLGNLTNTGWAAFANSTNSTSAFQIQNASGTGLFVSDTLNLINRPGIAASSSSVSQTDFELTDSDLIQEAVSLAIGVDGLPIIAHYEGDTGGGGCGASECNLKVTHCGNAGCTSGNTTTEFEDADNVGPDVSMAIGTDGLAIIAFTNVTGGNLQVSKCANILCTSLSSDIEISDADLVGDDPYIVIGSDGLPIIGHSEEDTGGGGCGANECNLKVTKCTTASCSSNSTTEFEDTNDVGDDIGVAITPDGLPIISYADKTGGNLQVSKCANISCTSMTATTEYVDADSTGNDTAITVAPDGLAIISHRNSTGGNLQVSKCANTSCTSLSSDTEFVDADSTGNRSSITIATDGLAIISHDNETGHNLQISKCANAGCTQLASDTEISDADDVGNDGTWMVIGTDGLPVIGHINTTRTDVQVTKCATRDCATSTGTALLSGVDIGTMAAGFRSVYFNTLNLGNPNARISLDDVGNFKANGLRIAPSTGPGSTVLSLSGGSDSLLEVKQLGTNFGGYAESGAFIDRNSYWAEEFSRDRDDLGPTTNAAEAWGDVAGLNVVEQTNSTADCTWSVVDDMVNGISRQATADTGTVGCASFAGSSVTATDAHTIADADNLPVILMKVRPSAAASADDTWVGLGDSFAADANLPTNGIFFTNNDGTTWTGVTRSSSTSTNVTCTGQTVNTGSTQFALLKIEVLSTSDVRFYVDNDVSNGVSWYYCGQSTSNIYTSGLTSMIKNSNDTSGDALDVDFFRIWQDDSQPQSEEPESQSQEQNNDNLPSSRTRK